MNMCMSCWSVASVHMWMCVLVQRYGLSELELGASLDTSMRGPLCSLNLVAYYSYAPFMFGKLFHCLVLYCFFFAKNGFSRKF